MHLELKMKVLILILPLIIVVSSRPTTITTTPQIEPTTNARDRNCGVETPEELIDDVIMSVQQKISEQRLYLMYRTGIVNVGPGQLIGLKTLNRSGAVDVTCNASTVNLIVSLATNKPIRARYDWDKFVNGKTEKGMAHARASSFQGHVTLSRSTNEGVASFRVIEINMTPSSDVEVNVGGLSHISWLWSRAIKFVSSMLLKAMSSAADDAVRDAFDDAFASLNDAT